MGGGGRVGDGVASISGWVGEVCRDGWFGSDGDGGWCAGRAYKHEALHPRKNYQISNSSNTLQ